MSYILSLDVSTSCTGVSIIENVKDFDSQKHIVKLDSIVFKDTLNFWQKCDYLQSELQKLHTQYPDITHFGVEAPMKRFAPGFSSAEIVCILQRFNGIACYQVRNLWGIDPTYVNVLHARKLCGIKILSKAKSGGLNAKQQTANYMLQNDLSKIDFQLKRGHENEQRTCSNIKPYHLDSIDAYIISQAILRSK